MPPNQPASLPCQPRLLVSPMSPSLFLSLPPSLSNAAVVDDRRQRARRTAGRAEEVCPTIAEARELMAQEKGSFVGLERRS